MKTVLSVYVKNLSVVLRFFDKKKLVTQSATLTSERVKWDADAFPKYSWLSWLALQQTFMYASAYWTDKTSFNVEGGKTGFDSEETKLATYSSSPFNQVCFGTRFENQDTFFVTNKTADSIFSVIAGNVLHPTSVGRNTLRKLFGNKGSLEPYCTTEGFNPVCFPILVRIGILFNDFSPCTQCGSWIAFGAGPSGCQLFAPPTISHAMGYTVVKWEKYTNSLIICRLFSGGSRGGARRGPLHFLRPPPPPPIWRSGSASAVSPLEIW